MGKGRGFKKPEFTEAAAELKTRYERLVFNHALNPRLPELFEERLSHAFRSGRDPQRFLDEEIREFRSLEAKALEKERQESVRDEARRRRIAGQTFADKVLDEYRRRIEHYPPLNIHADADPEVSKLYGGLELFDKRHYGTVETFLRRAFPQAGQIDRMNIEQRFWRFVSTRPGRLPEELESYRRSLAAPSATRKEKIQEAREAVKSAAFFLHDLLDVFEQASTQMDPDEPAEKAIEFIHGLISDFRLKEFRRR